MITRSLNQNKETLPILEKVAERKAKMKKLRKLRKRRSLKINMPLRDLLMLTSSSNLNLSEIKIVKLEMTELKQWEMPKLNGIQWASRNKNLIMIKLRELRSFMRSRWSLILKLDNTLLPMDLLSRILTLGKNLTQMTKVIAMRKNKRKRRKRRKRRKMMLLRKDSQSRKLRRDLLKILMKIKSQLNQEHQLNRNYLKM